MKFLHDANQLATEAERVAARQRGLVEFWWEKGQKHQDFSQIFDHHFSDEELTHIGQRNCQNLIGEITVPLAVAGPVFVKAEEAELDQEVFIPLATTEGALVPSIQRGCKAITQSGGAHVMVEQRGMTRAPVFQCADGVSARQFLDWMMQKTAVFSATTKSISSHLKFMDLQGWVVGRRAYLRCRYDTDQAMGMNMVTLAVQKAWDELSELLAKQHPELEVELIALSGNLCTDKKQAVINQLLGRGWWVQAEAHISSNVLQTVLKTTSKQIADVHVAKNVVGSQLAGHAAPNMQIANVATAFYLATGQDIAHVVDVSQGITTLENTEDGLYAAVTLPTVPLGTVGGGTWLPKQTAARQMVLGETQPTAAQLASVLAVAVLAAEISGMAALASQDLARAHQQHGRAQKDAA